MPLTLNLKGNKDVGKQRYSHEKTKTKTKLKNPTHEPKNTTKS